MQEINLKIADNGVIKTVTDDNINAAGEKYESVIVYDFDKGIDDRISFIKDICIDVGLDFGNSKQSNQIKVVTEWGTNYSPSSIETKHKIQTLKDKIRELENMIR
jgi:hypothetical protein